MEDLTDSDRMWLKKIEDHKPNLSDLDESERVWLKKIEETKPNLLDLWKLMNGERCTVPGAESAEEEFRLLLKLFPVELVTSPLYLIRALVCFLFHTTNLQYLQEKQKTLIRQC